jgi:3',5'-cyclic AMP phosphodiesterase CpdA
MKRLLLGIVAGFVLLTAALSGNQKLGNGDLQISVESRNPWTHLRLNNDPNDFKFVIVSDRTGGHRPGVFSRAVEQINLMQPEFVLSVGDLIEGYKKNEGAVTDEWKEFQGFVSKLQMPFFYVPGNHDVSTPYLDKQWKEKFGRSYYHFIYRDVLFLILNTDDPHGDPGHIGPEQITWARKTLDENRGVRWTIVALHRPIWAVANVEKTGWLEVEKALIGRQYTVFAGHIHHYQKFVRNGMNYYQLATTGGASRMRGLRYGEFDHITWVTMKKDGPLLANIMLDGIYPEDMRKPLTEEPGFVITNRKPTHPVQGKVFFDGTPCPDALVAFYVPPANEKAKPLRIGDALVESDGSFVFSTYTANDGAPVGDYIVTVVKRRPSFDAQGKPGPNQLPEKYAKVDTSDLRVKVKDGPNDIVLELKK